MEIQHFDFFFGPVRPLLARPTSRKGPTGGPKSKNKKTCLKSPYKCPESPSQTPFRRHVFFQTFCDLCIFRVFFRKSISPHFGGLFHPLKAGNGLNTIK